MFYVLNAVCDLNMEQWLAAPFTFHSELVQTRCGEAKGWSALGNLQKIADLLEDLILDLHRAMKKNSQMCKDTLHMLLESFGRPEHLQCTKVVTWGVTRLWSALLILVKANFRH